MYQSDREKLLDPLGWKLLAELQADARASFAELGRRVGLSTPAVAERVRRLQETPARDCVLELRRHQTSCRP